MTPLKRGDAYYAVWTCAAGLCNQHAAPARHWVSLRTGDKREAKAACAALEARLDADKVSLKLGLPRAVRTGMSLGEYRALYLACVSQDKAASTIRTEGFHLGSLIAYLGENFRLENMTQDVLEGYKRARLETIAPRSWNSELATLKSVFAWGTRREPPIYARNPFATISRVDKGAPTIEKYIQGEDLRKVVAACAPFWRNVVLFGYLTFCRGSELRGLTWDNVDLDAGVITFPETKERKKKTVPIIPALREVLGSAKTLAEGSRYVFPAHGGGMLTKDGLHHKLVSLGEAIGVKLSPHMLRHTGITDALKAGAPLFAVQKQAGHSQVTTTAEYGHMELGAQGDAMGKLAKTSLLAIR